MPEREVKVCPTCKDVKTSEGMGFVKEDTQAEETKKINQIIDVPKEELCPKCIDVSTG